MASVTGQPEDEAPGQVCDNERVGRDSARGLRVRDAMLTAPKTVPADATVGDLRLLFGNPHVVTALLVDGSRFVGVVHRGQLGDQIPDEDPARALAGRDVPTVEPDAPLSDAIALLDSCAGLRAVVLDPDGERLRGLLCLTTDRQGFCQS